MDKKTKQDLSDKHLLCFGSLPQTFFQTPGRIEWFGGYSSLHGGHRLTSAINAYLYASVSKNTQGVLRIITSQFPALTIALNGDDPFSQEHHPSSSMVKVLLQQCRDEGIKINQGIDIFLFSELKSHFHLGASTAFLTTVLEIMIGENKANKLVSLSQKQQWIQRAEAANPFHAFDHDEALSMLLGGTVLLDHSDDQEARFQNLTTSFKEHRIVLLHVKHQAHQPRLWMKQILEQMNIIAQHYQKEKLIEVDPLNFQHDLTDLSRMYGIKATNKVQYFFHELLATKRAFLFLEKQDEQGFFNLFNQAQVYDQQYLEHHLLPLNTESRLFATLKWLSQSLPHTAFRLQGLGFQGPILILIPKETYQSTYALLKRQFYQDNLLEVKMVSHGIRSSPF